MDDVISVQMGGVSFAFADVQPAEYFRSIIRTAIIGSKHVEH